MGREQRILDGTGGPSEAAVRQELDRVARLSGFADTDAFGDARDRVLVRSDGSTTYLCNDLAYHRDKLRRGWTHLVDIWGADHHGQVKSVQGGVRALCDVEGEPEVLLGAALPRRSMIAPRPGLAWMIDGSGPRLVQVAARMPE